jgi:hypothetical protein
MKFIILISNLKEISPSVFSWKKEYIKNEYQTFVVTTRKGKNSIALCLNGFQFRLISTDSFECENHFFNKEAIKKT